MGKILLNEKIIINDISMNIIRKKIKNINLMVSHSTGEIRLSAPLSLSYQKIYDFVLSKLSWIQKHRQIFDQIKKTKSLEYLSKDMIEYQGRPHKIELLLPENSSDAVREQAIFSFYRAQLLLHLPPLFEKWQNLIGVSISEFRIKKMKTRWGSCSIRARRIWINLELAKKPFVCWEYIVVHELVHLLEASHNHRFKSLMDRFLPEWRSCQKLLK